MAKQIHIQTSSAIKPMVYAYSTPGVEYHAGWVKIGYTDKQTVEDRVYQQTHTAGIKTKLEWQGTAYYDDGSYERFKDYEFHQYLEKVGIEREPNTEWFHIDGPNSFGLFGDFRQTRGILSVTDVANYRLRREQATAVEQTLAYAQSNAEGEYLWNAKPRFGKTLSVYDFIQRLGARATLILTNRPAVANSWYDDYKKFVGTGAGYRFVSETDALKKEEKYVLTPEQFEKAPQIENNSEKRRIEFVSLQDLKGSIYFGGEFTKLKHISEIEWDVLVIDEAHEGVDTYKTDKAFAQIKRKFTLHLSGTPFKALANEKFSADAIFNWTYADEQRAKRDWDSESANPYADLPQLNLYTYQMSEIVEEDIREGFEHDGEMVNYAFDLNEFFATNASGAFVHEASVDRFLDALTQQEKFPFSTDELRDELKHTLWLLNRVDSAKALAKKLRKHSVFGQYEIVLAAGDGKLDDDEAKSKAYNKVCDAIKEFDKTITLSVGQLTTGITIPQWTAVLMLANVKSPALYMQAAFRAQNPHTYRVGETTYRKENAYVFDFDPARTLEIYEAFANDLSASTAAGHGSLDERRSNVREALNFLPVIGEDPDGEMILLDAEQVLSIPRKIRAYEVVNRKFMSDFLFQNVANVFHAPNEVLELIKKIEPAKEPKKVAEISTDTAGELLLDDDGEVKVPEPIKIGLAHDLFGVKIYDDGQIELPPDLQTEVDAAKEKVAKEAKELERMSELFVDKLATPLIDKTKSEYDKDLTSAQKKELDKKVKEKATKAVTKAFGDLSIKKKLLEKEKQEQLDHAETREEIDAIEQEFAVKEQTLAQQGAASLETAAKEFVAEVAKGIADYAETKKLEHEKEGIEKRIKDHLRGFSRTIPSFLMAYGDENTKLENLDKIVPPEVFKEVASITVEEFAFLRDGGEYTDEATGATKTFRGELFDPVVFNDSIKRFLELKDELCDYFVEREGDARDIFDYIPPQKTNQIFTPKAVVRRMVDLLEQENPGCFEETDKTFADLYMKSGLYIAEIARRLFNSAAHKERFPDESARLKHIFERQLYGLAPTEIIYRIATNFLLGFDKDHEIDARHFQCLDALPYAKEGTLSQKLDEVFGE